MLCGFFYQQKATKKAHAPPPSTNTATYQGPSASTGAVRKKAHRTAGEHPRRNAEKTQGDGAQPEDSNDSVSVVVNVPIVMF